MKISTALKRKNKLKIELSRLRERINRHNSVLVGNERPYDIGQLQGELSQKTEELIDLKTRLFMANLPIQRLVFEMSELKGLAKFYRTLDVKKGQQEAYSRFGGGEPRDYETVLTEADVDRITADLEARIDTIQEQLDVFNATTELP